MAGERINKRPRPAAAEPQAAAGVIDNDDEAFPRGGGGGLLTPLQKRQLTHQANMDAAADQKSGARANKKPKTKVRALYAAHRRPPPPPAAAAAFVFDTFWSAFTAKQKTI
jgi:hypothetical protein